MSLSRQLERWHRAQAIESEYWQRTSQDAQEFLRILYEKQQCLDMVRTQVPESVTVPLDEHRRVVEIGIGPMGIGVATLLTPPGAWEIVGVEPLPRVSPLLPPLLRGLHDEAQSLPITYVQRMGEDTGLPSGVFDLAICYNVLDHTPNWRGILDEIWRTLRPGGHVLLSVDTLCILNKLRWAFWQRWAWKNSPYIIAHPYRFTAFRLERILQHHGFNLVWMQKTGHEWLTRVIGKARRLTVVGFKKTKVT